MTNSSVWVVKAIPAVVGLGVAWVGIRLVRNEKNLTLRQIELEQALAAKSKKERIKHLLGG